MYEVSLKKTVAWVSAIACGAVLTACATDDYAPAAAAAASEPVLATAPQTQHYRAVRASELIGKPLRNAHGDYLGQIGDLVLDMSTGDVRYAVVSTGPQGTGRFYLVPARSFMARSESDVGLDITPAELTRYQSWRSNQWPSMRDTAFWNDMDRLYGFSEARAGTYYDRWSELAGRTVYDRSGHHLGQIRDLIINLTSERVHYAVISFEPGVAAADRLYAVPLYAFMAPRDRANRLVLNLAPAQIAALESFDVYHWPRLNEPAYVTRIDRYFATAFPLADVTSFERLDTNHDGFLSKAELAPLGMTTDSSGRYVLRTTQSASALFHRLDIDHDGFLTRSEAEPTLSAASFDRLDTNRDGFLSIGEATPELAVLASSDRNVLSFDSLDRDHDGFLSKAEAAPLFGGTTVVRVPRSSPPAVVSFDSLDRDHDGFISRDEARAAWGANASVFDRYDTNQDGFLSRAEADPLLRSGIGASSGEPVHRTIIVH